MINNTSMAILLALTDIGWGIGILISIHEGSCKPNLYWFVFAIFLLMIGTLCIIVAMTANIKINLSDEFSEYPISYIPS